MTLKELNMQSKVYGDVPPSFQHRVEYALRRTQEERPMKKFTLRTFALALVLVAVAGIAFAAVTSMTADYFTQYYGETFGLAARLGDVDSSKPAVQVGDLVYTMDDVIVTGLQLGRVEDNEGASIDDSLCTYILATGTIKPAEGANVVLMPEDYLVSDPWNFNPYEKGRANIPAGTPTVLEKATEQGAKILCARTTANGLLNDQGELIPCDIGYNGTLLEDGTMLFSMEIIPMEPIPRQDAYTLSVYVANHEVSATDEHLMDTRQAQDWVFTIFPTKAAE